MRKKLKIAEKGSVSCPYLETCVRDA